ncbi:hypothetical protein GGR56DRAFT_541400 [Xylariaceae sp. FL0804]|nr:hypothetical protein GGR56DRAFT_541400 [Xylariaceae sp. FL0804]
MAATSAYGGHHDHYHDHDVLLQTIDGLLGGIAFLEGADDHTKGPNVPTSLHEPANTRLNDAPVTARLFTGEWEDAVDPFPESRQRQHQWAVLTRFREKTDRLHEALERHAAPDGRELARRWLRRYPTPSELRRSGLLMLAEIHRVGSTVVDDKLDLFAAMLVQHATQELHRELVGPDGRRDASAISVWRDSLFDDSEQAQIEQFYSELCSREAQLASTRQDASLQSPQGLFLGSGRQFDGEAISSMLSPTNFLHPMSIEATPPENTGIMWDPSVAGPAPAQLEAGRSYIPSSYQNPDSGGICQPAFPYAINSASSFSMPVHPAIFLANSGMASVTPTSPSYNADTFVQQNNDVDYLRVSHPFQMFQQFLYFLFGTSCRPNQDSVLWLFSNTKGEKVPRQYRNSVACDRHVRFTAEIQQSLLGPLIDRPFAKDPIIRGIIATASCMVKMGNLQSVRQIEVYLTSLGRHLIPSPEAFRHFAKEALNMCLSTSRQPVMRPFCYPETIQEPVLYTDAYVEAQLGSLSITRQGSYAPRELIEHISTRPRSSRAQNLTVSSSRCSFSYRSTSPATSVFDETISYSSLTQSCKTCSHCGRQFAGKSASTSLSRHIRQDHNMVLYRCPYCPKTDKRSDNLCKHIEKLHPSKDIPKFGKKGKGRTSAAPS